MSNDYLPGKFRYDLKYVWFVILILHVGAMVLAHSLKDNGTRKQLAVLVTLDTLATSTIEELKVWSSNKVWRVSDVDC